MKTIRAVSKYLIIVFATSTLNAQEEINIINYFANNNQIIGVPVIDQVNKFRFYPDVSFQEAITSAKVNYYIMNDFFQTYLVKRENGHYWESKLRKFKLGESIQRVEVIVECNRLVLDNILDSYNIRTDTNNIDFYNYLLLRRGDDRSLLTKSVIQNQQEIILQLDGLKVVFDSLLINNKRFSFGRISDSLDNSIKNLTELLDNLGNNQVANSELSTNIEEVKNIAKKYGEINKFLANEEAHKLNYTKYISLLLKNENDSIKFNELADQAKSLSIIESEPLIDELIHAIKKLDLDDPERSKDILSSKENTDLKITDSSKYFEKLFKKTENLLTQKTKKFKIIIENLVNGLESLKNSNRFIGVKSKQQLESSLQKILHISENDLSKIINDIETTVSVATFQFEERPKLLDDIDMIKVKLDSIYSRYKSIDKKNTRLLVLLDNQKNNLTRIEQLPNFQKDFKIQPVQSELYNAYIENRASSMLDIKYGSDTTKILFTFRNDKRSLQYLQATDPIEKLSIFRVRLVPFAVYGESANPDLKWRTDRIIYEFALNFGYGVIKDDNFEPVMFDQNRLGIALGVSAGTFSKNKEERFLSIGVSYDINTYSSITFGVNVVDAINFYMGVGLNSRAFKDLVEGAGKIFSGSE